MPAYLVYPLLIGLLKPPITMPKTSRAAIERERAYHAEQLALLDAQLEDDPHPPLEDAPACLGYLTKTAGCYQQDAATGPPPSFLTLALQNFGRELPELSRALRGKEEPKVAPESAGVYAALNELTLDNDAIWAREGSRESVPAPWVIKAPYYVLCATLDNLFEGRPIARFWFLETVARMPYFGYISLLHLYESLGWWRRSAEFKRIHFEEERNEFHHLLIMESLGGDQKWSDRFLAQHAAIVYYWLLVLMWVVSPTLAYNFSELIEAHAVDTYAEFVDANEELLTRLPPPRIATSFYNKGGASAASADGHAARGPVRTLYDVFCNVRDDEAEHTSSMRRCQDPDIRSRAKIFELGAVAAAAAVIAVAAVDIEGFREIESLVGTEVATEVDQIERAVVNDLEEIEIKSNLDEKAREATAISDLMRASEMDLEK